MNMFKPVIQAMCVPIISLVDMMRSRNKASKGKISKSYILSLPGAGFRTPLMNFQSKLLYVYINFQYMHVSGTELQTNRWMNRRNHLSERGNENKMFKSRLELSLS